MKNYISILICGMLLLPAIPSTAQWINSITMVPAVPSTGDTIYVYADLSFPSGSCDEHTQTLAVSGNNIYASALHCLGVLAVICNYTDTFKIDPLPAGNYVFHLQVDAGGLPSPCTPGIVPGPSDSLNFIVINPTGVPTEGANPDIEMYPNPAKDHIRIVTVNVTDNSMIAIFDLEGKLVWEKETNSSIHEINLSRFATGIYTVRILNRGKPLLEEKFEVIK
jgi:hypothetical protein